MIYQPERTLLLLRHGKSAWNTNAPDDYSRPLKSRGQTAARAMAHWLREHGFANPHIISSGALRARSTAELVADTLALPQHAVELDDRLYHATVPSMLALCRACDNAVSSLMLVGHNPGLEDLCELLSAQPLACANNGKLMPTAALAVLPLPGPWQALAPGSVHGAYIVRPRDLVAPDRRA